MREDIREPIENIRATKQDDQHSTPSPPVSVVDITIICHFPSVRRKRRGRAITKKGCFHFHPKSLMSTVVDNIMTFFLSPHYILR